MLICDEKRFEQFGNYDKPGVDYLKMDVCDAESFNAIEAEEGDNIYHFAARLLVPILPRKQRRAYFRKALYEGTENVLNWMEKHKLANMIYYTTDTVYGHTEIHPRTEQHPRKPIGP